MRLESTPWKTKFGLKLRPLFRVVGWKKGSAGGEPDKQIKPPKDCATLADMDDVPPAKSHADFEDEVPFTR